MNKKAPRPPKELLDFWRSVQEAVIADIESQDLDLQEVCYFTSEDFKD